MSNTLQFEVLRPVGLAGRKEKGEVVELSLEDAQNIGGEYLKAVKVDGFGKKTDNEDVVLRNVEVVKAPVKVDAAEAKAAEDAANAEAEAAKAAAAEVDAKAEAAAAEEKAAADAAAAGAGEGASV